MTLESSGEVVSYDDDSVLNPLHKTEILMYDKGSELDPDTWNADEEIDDSCVGVQVIETIGIVIYEVACSIRWLFSSRY